jgi:membrane protease YdiL (CAAX protease family)
MALPLLGLALVVTLFVMLSQRETGGAAGVDSFGPSGGPAHPIVEYVATGDVWTHLQILLLACVVAPVVEETMFRGVLYRHLRELSCRWGAVLSVLLSATVASFLFAFVHPQGLIGVPLLMALADGFTAAREWRGTLIPAMVGHGLSNGLVMMFTILAMAD